MDNAAILAELRAMADNPPDLATYKNRGTSQWLAKAHALIKLYDTYAAIEFKTAWDWLGGLATGSHNAEKILSTMYRVVAELEIEVGSVTGKAFGPGAVYDFQKNLRDLIGSATRELLIVDPWFDEAVFDEYLSTLPAGVSVRLFALKASPSMKSTVAKYVQQHGARVELRSSSAVHDRLFFIDRQTCWASGQSIKDAAKHKPTYLVPLPADVAQLKLALYEAEWAKATMV
jgi:hypothetical protein